MANPTTGMYSYSEFLFGTGLRGALIEVSTRTNATAHAAGVKLNDSVNQSRNNSQQLSKNIREFKAPTDVANSTNILSTLSIEFGNVETWHFKDKKSDYAIVDQDLNFVFMRETSTSYDRLHANNSSYYSYKYYNFHNASDIIYDLHGNLIPQSEIKTAINPDEFNKSQENNMYNLSITQNDYFYNILNRQAGSSIDKSYTVERESFKSDFFGTVGTTSIDTLNLQGKVSVSGGKQSGVTMSVSTYDTAVQITDERSFSTDMGTWSMTTKVGPGGKGAGDVSATNGSIKGGLKFYLGYLVPDIKIEFTPFR